MMIVAPTTAAADLTLNGEIFMQTPPHTLRLAAAFALVLASLAPAVAAQSAQADPERERAFALFAEQKFVEALAPLEKLAARHPDDGNVLARFGMTLFMHTIPEAHTPARQTRRSRARAALVRALELGFDEGAPKDLIQQMVASVNADGSDSPTSDSKFSANAEADAAMRKGEAAFLKGNYDEALAAYEQASSLDPKIYEAPLFAGDVMLQKGQLEKAGEWYARAIRLDPDREQAYRYWGNTLLKQARLDEARDKYIEAVIAAPYEAYTWENGLFRWANAKLVRLGHPKIDVQQSVSPMKDNKMTIIIDPRSLEKSDDGSAAWMWYGLKRAVWTTNDYEKFRKEYPGEKKYRHSLREEADALRGVIEAVRNKQKAGEVKQLSKDLQLLLQIEEAGLLEAYVLFARPDEGIARDYAEYRKANRDKLRRYLVEYLASGKY
ncbi:MAG: tetratricopeptide repeat protein [Pyrinomonadaceae bacterium]